MTSTINLEIWLWAILGWVDQDRERERREKERVEVRKRGEESEEKRRKEEEEKKKKKKKKNCKPSKVHVFVHSSFPFMWGQTVVECRRKSWAVQFDDGGAIIICYKSQDLDFFCSWTFHFEEEWSINRNNFACFTGPRRSAGRYGSWNTFLQRWGQRSKSYTPDGRQWQRTVCAEREESRQSQINRLWDEEGSQSENQSHRQRNTHTNVCKSSEWILLLNLVLGMLTVEPATCRVCYHRAKRRW